MADPVIKPQGWRVVDPAGLRWRSWDGLTVVHHAPSGDTQLLNAIAADTLTRLVAGVVSVDALVEHVAQRHPELSSVELARQVRILLDELAELGIIEPTVGNDDGGEASGGGGGGGGGDA